MAVIFSMQSTSILITNHTRITTIFFKKASSSLNSVHKYWCMDRALKLWDITCSAEMTENHWRKLLQIFNCGDFSRLWMSKKIVKINNKLNLLKSQTRLNSGFVHRSKGFFGRLLPNSTATYSWRKKETMKK